LLSTSSYTMSSIFTSFFSSFEVHADAPSSEEQPAKEDSNVEAEDADVVEKAAAEEAEEEEPEDLQPGIREECKASAKCAALTKHFEHCQEKVHSGQGFKGEDCVEELFHMMHCVDADAAPKLFAKLR